MMIQKLAATFGAWAMATAVVAGASSPEFAGSAWRALLERDPSIADDASVDWRQRLILHLLTPRQAEAYFSGRATAQELMLSDGRTLAAALDEPAARSGGVYVPMAVSCRLFAAVTDDPAAAGVHSERSFKLGRFNLSGQGGSSSGCPIPPDAMAVVLQIRAQGIGLMQPRIKLWAEGLPEPAAAAMERSAELASEDRTATAIVNLCAAPECGPAGLRLKTSHAALVEADLIGYFRPLSAADGAGAGPRPIFPLATEGLTNNFFGTNAGAGNTTGAANSFFGGEAGMSNTSGSWNSFFGRVAGRDNTTGNRNSFFGRQAGRSNTTASDNSFFGNEAGAANTTGAVNSFFGSQAGFSNTSGSWNSFFGSLAGFSNTSGSSNSFFGNEAGRDNTEGTFNSFFGNFAGESNTTGTSNSFLGRSAGRRNTTGASNSFFGVSAGFSNTTGSSNSFFGRDAGNFNTTGFSNSFFGRSAGSFNTVEDNNTFIGAFSNGAAGITNATALGHRARVLQSNSLVLGSIAGLNEAFGTPHASVNVGIGTPTPEHPLHVERADGSARVLVKETNATATPRTLFALENNGAVRFNFINNVTGDDWFFSQDGLGRYIISLVGSGGPELLIAKDGRVLMGPGPSSVFDLSPSGNLEIAGMLLQNSDRGAKTNIEKVDAAQVLSKVVELPISTWSFRADESTRHMGPMAQDFHAAFGLGPTDTKLSALDAAGAALAAIRGLYELAQEQKRENERLQAELERLQGLERRMAALEAALGGATD